MNIQILDIVNLTTPFLGGIVGWFVGRRKQKNDFLTDLQSTIDFLVAKNKELYFEVVALRGENSFLRSEVDELKQKLEGVKIITKKINVHETN